MTDSATFTTPEAGDDDLGDLLLEVLPPDGSNIGNLSAREALSRAAERQVSEEEYEAIKKRLVDQGLIRKGRGRGGSLALAERIESNKKDQLPEATQQQETNDDQNEDTKALKAEQRKEPRYSEAILDYLANTCVTLAGLQKTLRHFREFREEEKKTLELCFAIQSKIGKQVSDRQAEKLRGMFY